MDLNTGFLIAQIINFIMLGVYAVMVVQAFRYLRVSGLSGLTLFAWVAVVIFMPLLGALAVLIIRPRDEDSKIIV